MKAPTLCAVREGELYDAATVTAPGAMRIMAPADGLVVATNEEGCAGDVFFSISEVKAKLGEIGLAVVRKRRMRR